MHLDQRSRSFRKSFLRVFLRSSLLTAIPAAMAQSTAGSAYGNISDSTGAVIGKAQVTLTDVHTNAQQTIITDESEDFTFSAVKPSEPAAVLA